MDGLVTRVTMTDQVVELLEAMVLDHELEPGDMLPSEGELATRFGVSRLVVREAVRALQARGLVSVHQGKRPTVATPNARLLEDYFSFAVRRDPDALADLLEVRAALETHTARLAAAAGPSDAQQRLTEAFRALEDDVDDLERFLAADGAFHAAVAAASGHGLLQQLVGALDASLAPSRRQSLEGHVASGHPVREVVETHRAVLAAIVHGDADRAAEAMAALLAQSRRNLAAYHEAAAREA